VWILEMLCCERKRVTVSSESWEWSPLSRMEGCSPRKTITTNFPISLFLTGGVIDGQREGKGKCGFSGKQTERRDGYRGGAA
jgi:hypothetical protein